MPLSEKARIEVYIPDLLQQTYQNLLNALAQEFTYTFGQHLAQQRVLGIPPFQHRMEQKGEQVEAEQKR